MAETSSSGPSFEFLQATLPSSLMSSPGAIPLPGMSYSVGQPILESSNSPEQPATEPDSEKSRLEQTIHRLRIERDQLRADNSSFYDR